MSEIIKLSSFLDTIVLIDRYISPYKEYAKIYSELTNKSLGFTQVINRYYYLMHLYEHAKHINFDKYTIAVIQAKKREYYINYIKKVKYMKSKINVLKFNKYFAYNKDIYKSIVNIIKEYDRFTKEATLNPLLGYYTENEYLFVNKFNIDVSEYDLFEIKVDELIRITSDVEYRIMTHVHISWTILRVILFLFINYCVILFL